MPAGVAVIWLVALGSLTFGFLLGIAAVVGVFLAFVFLGGPRDLDS